MIDLLRPLLMRRARRLLLALALSALTLAAGAALLGVSGWFLTGAALAGAAGGLSFDLFAPSAAVRGLSFLRIGARYGERMTSHVVTLELLSDLRVDVFRKLIPLVPLQGAARRTGDIVARLTADIEALDLVLLQAGLPLATALFGAVGLSVLLMLTLPEALPVALGGFAVTAIALPLALVAGGRRSGAARVEASARLRVTMLDSVDGHADLVAFGALAEDARRFEAAASALAAARLTESRRAALGPALTQLGAGLTMVATLWLGLHAVAQGRLSGPVLVGLLLAILALFEVTGPILRGAARIGGAVAAGRRVRAITRAEPRVRERHDPLPLPGEGRLEIETIRYGHAPGRAVLDGVSLTLAPGERVALVGESGSGKSTLLGLLVRLDDVEAGCIRYGGVDIRDVGLAALRRRIAMLTQDAPIFIGTVRDNLRIGDPDADDAALMAALGRARLSDFLASLPHGLDTWLGEAGATLSAGQARRLCLARALLAPARLLLLDEPTAGLDPETERSFLADLAAATEGRAVILATHAVLPHGAVERSIHLQEGRIV